MKTIALLLLVCSFSYSQNYLSQPYPIQQPTSNVNLELVQQTLSSKQAKYDFNLKRLREVVDSSVMYIYDCSKNKGYTYEEGKRSVTEFEVYYVNKVRYGKYDLSYDFVVEDLISFLTKGAFKIACDNFKDCD